MTRQTPLLSQHQQAEALLETYGPSEAGIQVVQTFGEVDLEYAALRRGCGLVDQPQRGTLEVTGADRIEFLGRMLTQELKDFHPHSARRSFWLSRKGRIDADLRLLNLPGRVLVDVDAHAVERTREGLSAYVITEDCTIVDQTQAWHRLALHGPSAAALMARVSTPVAGDPVETLAPGRISVIRVGGEGEAGGEVIVDRDDSAGEIGLELTMPTGLARLVWDQLMEVGFPGADQPNEHGRTLTSAPYHMRPIGWAAYNVARIEAGSPLYYLDFGPDSLPHESGVLESRVSFTKGCYLGQEIVARMQSLGSPKQRVACVKLPAPTSTADRPIDPTGEAEIQLAPQPVTGGAVFQPPAAALEGDRKPTPSDCGEAIGAITSSAISPMLGGAPICFAMLKTKHAAPGTPVLVECEGALLRATVQAELRSWPRPAAR